MADFETTRQLLSMYLAVNSYYECGYFALISHNPLASQPTDRQTDRTVTTAESQEQMKRGEKLVYPLHEFGNCNVV